MTITITDLILDIARLIIAISYVWIAFMWLTLGPGFPFYSAPSIRVMISVMLILDAVTFVLDVLARYVPLASSYDVLVNAALASVAAVTAVTLARRYQVIWAGVHDHRHTER